MATRIRHLDNSDGGSASQHKFVLQYNHSLDRFVLTSSDSVLSLSSDDSDISDTFVDQLEDELDKENLTVFNLDGGSF